ncbi:hypothetical protein CC85DRAFT_207076 [Cutaneotrichosporon oleaginosum]|uniref:Uncharacterized protein n=1 Tax=Cutaneotrichosporon oleaginosum TaxID=879819 RepID=A0A0J0XDI9_9TREE|nr:uncharacterized protein CC85DRAFT_207076 [Cutaneotrichosporon oleaginosum]KLT39103.1 hypothetical protein CC85DRAFT_207076 [Cutaneotrichosporon oleaginosum]
MMVAEQMEEWVIVRVGMEVEEGECSGDARDGERGSRREAPRLVAQASWGFGGGGGGGGRAGRVLKRRRRCNGRLVMVGVEVECDGCGV